MVSVMVSLKQRIATALAAAFVLSGCQSSPLRSFEKIHTGMDKNNVLQVMGGPNTTTRFHGKDRWIYRFYEDEIRFEKEVHFMDGVAVYVGDPWTPAAGKNAEAVDQRNEELALQEEQNRIDEKKRNAQALDEYEKAAQGRQNKVKYVPVFQEIK